MRKNTANKTMEIAEILSEICNVSFTLNRGWLLSEAKLLQKDERFTIALLRKVYGEGGLWYNIDWRGKRGQEPTPYQIRQTWDKYTKEIDDASNDEENHTSFFYA